MALQTKKGSLAVKRPVFEKIETDEKNAFKRIQQRVEMIQVDLVMDYDLDGNHLIAGEDRVILRGTAGTERWCTEVWRIEGKEFVLCPETSVVGFFRPEGKK